MRKSGLASLAIYYHDFREDQKKDLRGLRYSSFVISPISIMISFLLSIRHTAMVHKIPATMTSSSA